MTSPLASAYAALDDCDEALRKLDAGCCEPGRSPRMKALAETLRAARRGLDRADGDSDAADEALGVLEDAGSQVGRLQVGCCAPSRLPLYAKILEGLTAAQITLSRSLDRGH